MVRSRALRGVSNHEATGEATMIRTGTALDRQNMNIA